MDHIGEKARGLASQMRYFCWIGLRQERLVPLCPPITLTIGFVRLASVRQARAEGGLAVPRRDARMATVTKDPNRCIVAIRTSNGGLVKAFGVLTRGEDVYTNYSDSSTPEAHTSYHKSGQYHMKKGKRYIEWDGGPTGQMEPMKLYKTPSVLVLDRVRFWTVGWEVPNLNIALPVLNGTADMIVDATHLEPGAILAFEASIIGQKTKEQRNVVGYPIIASYRFGNSVFVEICSFVVRDEQDDNPFDL